MSRNIRRCLVLPLLVLGALGALLLIGCSGEESNIPRYSDASQPIQVQVGDTFQITLPDAGLTDKWKLTDDGDDNLLSLFGHYDEIPTSTDTGITKIDVYTFYANASGETQVTFGLVPRDDLDATPSETKTFTVQIH